MLTVVNWVAVLFLLPMSLLVQSSNPGGGLNDDVLGLIVFKADLIDPHSRLALWNEEDNSPCNWVGVKCNPATNRVSELNLDGLSLSGHIGKGLIKLQYLQVLKLPRNNISGTINLLAQIPSLLVIDLSENNLSGSIPEELFQQCGSLKSISLASNNFTGSIPQSLSSCSNLESLNFSSNQLSGQLSSDFWNLSSVQSLDLSDNLLEGQIPAGIDVLLNLEVINLSRNRLGGNLPPSMRNLGSSCKYLNVSGNFLTGEINEWIGEMRSLEFLDISGNLFSGRVPVTMGSLQFLKEVNLSKNRFVGNLPESFGNCYNLKVIDGGHNLFSGNLPSWVFNSALEIIDLSGNRYSGSISFPSFYTQLYQTLLVLDVSSNTLTGEIPSAIGNFDRLQVLNLSCNSLVGLIPSSIGQLNTTFVLDMSHNQLTGGIADVIGRAALLQELRLESNFLNGPIPIEIQNCSSLTSLVLSRNNLTGPIPVAIATLSNLKLFDVSFNSLSGNLPNELTNLSHLVSLNVSFNHLEGELPVGGFFNTIPPSSVLGNPSLCGSAVQLICPSAHAKPLVLNPNSSAANHNPLSSSLRHKRIVLSISSLVAIGAAIVIALGVVTITILNMHARTSMARSAAALAFSGRDDYSPSHESEANYGKLVMFSGDADFATGAQGLLNKDSELGRGGFGTVYRTETQDKRPIVIKKLNTTSLVKSQEEFEREIKKLGKIRHENLVGLEGYYWTPSLQLLINEYIPRGSLYRHLHEEDEFDGQLTWQQRFRIILGTAKGLAHLHRLNVIHYNMKSSNVLINFSGEPKVGDFGLARLLPALDRYILSSKIQSALGYMAPEFACQTVKITEKCDVYGFGILILEVITGKRPVEYMEDDVVVLCDMVREALDEGRIEECIDKRLKGNYPVEEAIPVVKLGLICASQVPSNRPDMEEVTRILELIRCPAESQEELEGFSR
ncbi:hypothetical protein CASFOL_000620 [Castilleja foliolosa]|uniref:Protein kinase domain-containing protein n=1 Tax=Castilleja foliolosa TaxID=1961234 RepID=A0ABD3ENN6_9LAMI